MADKDIRLEGYAAWLGELKSRIESGRLAAARSVNRELILLYWDIGCGIVEKQAQLSWGNSVVERLSRDLKAEFPGIRGFSARNLWDMRRLVETYSHPESLSQVVRELNAPGFETLQQVVAELDDVSRRQAGSDMTKSEAAEFLRQVVAEIPWGHNLLILNKISDVRERIYYLLATARFGWSRNVLINQIKAGAYERSLVEGKQHNFPAALPEHLAEQAEEAMKSSYNLEFLGISREVKERELEDRLIEQLQTFLLELGYGFCFVGRQYRLALGDKEYFVDLLFYHRFLKSLVAFELKVGSFKPEYAGKMDFYLNLLNEKERVANDNPSIGIILCAEKDKLEVEFSLKSKTNPIGVAEYQLKSTLPRELKGKLPTDKQLSEAIGLQVKKKTKKH